MKVQSKFIQPLFVENAHLKSELIDLNVYIEERKLYLCKFLSDTGPNGEDYILEKAVGDLQQICTLVGSMFYHNEMRFKE